MNPRHSDLVAHLQVLNRRTLFDHPTGDFVAENQWSLYDCRQLRPIPIGDMQIGMAHAARFDLDQDFLGPRLRRVHFLHGQRLLEFMQNGGFHDKDRTRQGLQARKKNSTALATRSVNRWGPLRSTAH